MWSGGAEYATTPAYSVSASEGVHRSPWPYTDPPSGWLKTHAQQWPSLPHLRFSEHGGVHVTGGPGICLSAQCISMDTQHMGSCKQHPSCSSLGQGNWGASTPV